MTYSLTWLPSVLEGAGLKVAEVDGWQNRGRGDVGSTLGVLCHHTAGPKAGNMPSLRTLIEGRSDLPGPLAQLGLGRDGTFYVVAAGRCNHAGIGAWRGINAGNTNFVGIEAENTGLSDENWPVVQMNAYRHGVAALLAHAGLTAEFCAGHKEYAMPPGRKTDPDFDMVEFRRAVAAILAGAEPSLALIPKVTPDASGSAGKPTLRRGAAGGLVMQIQKAIGLANPSGVFDAYTEAAVRAFQRTNDLVPDGIVGPKTWGKLNAVET